MSAKERSKSPVHFIACLSPCTTLKVADSDKDFNSHVLCHKCGCPKKKCQNTIFVDNVKHEKMKVCKNKDEMTELFYYTSKPKFDEIQDVKADLKRKSNFSPTIKEEKFVTNGSISPETICKYCGHSSLECYGKMVKVKEKCPCGEKKNQLKKMEPKVEYALLNDIKTKREPLKMKNGCSCEQRGIKCPVYQEAAKNGGGCMCSELKQMIEKAQNKERMQNSSQTEFEEMGKSESSTQVELPQSNTFSQTEKEKTKSVATQTEGKEVKISNYSTSEPGKELRIRDDSTEGTSRSSTPKKRRRRNKPFGDKDKKNEKRRRARQLKKRERSKTNQNENQTFMIPRIEIDSKDIQRILNIGLPNEIQKCISNLQRSNYDFQTPLKLVIQHPQFCEQNLVSPPSSIKDRKETTL